MVGASGFSVIAVWLGFYFNVGNESKKLSA